MIKGIQAISSSEIKTSLLEVLVPQLTALLQMRGVGHCMKVSDLPPD